MKKRLFIIISLCVFNVIPFIAQDGTWKLVPITDIMKDYTFREIVFPQENNAMRGYTEGSMFGEDAEGNGVVAQTRNGGSSWQFVTAAKDSANKNSSFGGLLGGKSVNNNMSFVWGKERTLLKAKYGFLWSMLYPPSDVDQPNFFAAEFTMDGQTGVVTDGKNIYYTSDEGVSWSTAKVPDGINELQDIVIAGEQLLYAVGKGGQILKSTDAGQEWNMANSSVSNIDFTAVIFENENHGIIAGVNPDNPDEGSIWITNDGGVNVYKAQSFTSGSYHKFTLYRNGSDISLYTISSQGEIICSTDKGQNWSVVKEKTELEGAMAFTKTPHDVMYVAGENGLLGINAPELKADFSSYMPEPDNQNIYGFTNHSKGYIDDMIWYFENANPPNDYRRDVARVEFFKTGKCKATLIIGGKCPGSEEAVRDTLIKELDIIADYAWELFMPSSIINNQVVFPEGQNLIGFMTTATGTSGSAMGSILKTVDGGNTWDVVLESPKSGEYLVKGLEGLAFCNMNRGFACGFADKWESPWPQLWKTTDGGDNWQLVKFEGEPQHPSTETFNDIKFWDDENGVLSCLTAIYYTEDGGDTWILSEIESNKWNNIEAEMSIMKLCYGDKNTVYGVGKDYQIFKSIDGGKKWNLVNSLQPGAGRYYMNAAFRDANYGIIVSDDTSNGMVYITEDGGNTLSEAQTNAYTLYSSVIFVNDTTVYIGGAESILLKSEDAGKTWLPEKHPSIRESMKSFDCTSTGIVFASASSGVFKRYIPDMVADFDMDILSEADRIVTFSNKSLGFITDYEWKIGNEIESTNFNPDTITFPADGTYEIILKVSGKHPGTDELLSETVSKRVTFGGSSIEGSKLSAIDLHVISSGPDKLSYSFNLPESNNVGIELIDINGIKTFTVDHGLLQKGKYTFDLNTTSLSRGIYFLRFNIDEQNAKTIKVIK